MRPTPDKMRAFMAQLRKKMNLKSLVVTLAAIVVFTTTYLLILPAFTLDKEEAAEQGGIDVAVEQTVEEEAPAEKAEEPAAEQKESADTVKEAEEPVAKEEVKEDAASPKQKDSDAKDDKEEVKLLSKKKELTAEKEKSDDFTISAVVDKDAKVPEDVFLQAAELTKDTEGFDYDKYYKDALKALKKDSGNVKGIKTIKFYDISLEAESQDESVEPKSAVDVKIEYEDGLKVKDADNIRIVHFAEKKNGEVKAEVIDDSKVETTVNAKSQMTETTFKTDGFSEFAVVEVETMETSVIAADGKTYKVSVTYGKDAGVPEGSRLEVSEVTGADAEPYLEKAASTLKKDADELSFAKFFDIKIMNGDDEVKIEKPVNVEINLLDNETLTDNTQVLHFESKEKADRVDSSVDGNTVKFEAEGFSVYAVVSDPDSPEARITVNFYNYDGTEKLATVYVKKSDQILGDGERQSDISYLEDIVADPGAGTLGDGELFRGWSPDDLMDSTGARFHDSSDYVGKDYTLDTAPMTIEQIREYLDSLDDDENYKEGDIVNIYAMVYKYFSVTYYGLDPGVSLGSDIVLRLRNQETSSYTVNMPFTADPNAKFMGWKTNDYANIVPAGTANTIYENKQEITIKGDVVFKVYAPIGNWLIYETNGKGGTYNAPEFYLTGQRTVQAEGSKPEHMKRYGYTFGGWYTDEDCTDGNEYEFNELLTSNRTIYAKWNENDNAPYTVLIWRQKIGEDGKVSDDYELYASHPSEGKIGTNIPYTIVNNGDQSYATLTNADGTGTGTEYQYTGFYLNPDIDDAEITVDGKAVLNLYYDRIQYNVRFYVYRTPGSNSTYSYGNNSQAGQNTWGIVNYHNSNDHPDLTNAGRAKYGNLTASQNIDGYTGYYFTVSARYGEKIAAQWPTYDDIQGADNRSPVSFVMMNGTRLKPQPSAGGDGTVKGIVSYMDENILGLTNSSDGNFLIVRFNTYNEWTYHIYLEALPDADGNYPAGAIQKTINGETRYYVRSDADEVHTRSSNTIPDSQNAPKLNGYNTVMKSASVAYSDGYDDSIPQANGVSGYYPVLNYYYNRITGHISYMDGQYIDGDGHTIQNYSGNLLHESEEMPHGTDITDRNKGEENYYIPDLPAGESGYVFEGWYFDKACTQPYTFDTMPIGGVLVYAKWRKIEYRVFLHPNAGDSESNPDLYWGSDTQAMNFRVAYGDKVSTPTGIWTEGLNEFIAWFTEDGQVFDGDLFVLNEDTVTEDYDKTLPENYTDKMDKWGNGATYNKDAQEDRWWITKKLDLYAQWREVTPGAKGIDVYYNAIGFDTADPDPDKVVTGTVNGDTEYKDPFEYLDSAGVVSTSAAIPDNADDYQFLYWVVQEWDEDKEEYVDVIEDGKRIEVYPGDEFTAYKKYCKVDVTEWKDKDGHTSSTQSDVYNIISKATYSMYLRAEYGPSETATPTHIDWYLNTGVKDTDASPDRRDIPGGLQINEAVDIYGNVIPEREGYTFLGWARVPTTVSGSEYNEDVALTKAKVLGDDANAYMYLQYENGQFTLNDLQNPNNPNNGKKVLKVAADEVLPYHDMYALWEKKNYTVTIKKEMAEGSEDYKYETFNFTINFGEEDENFGLNGVTEVVSGVPYINTRVFNEKQYESTFKVSESSTDFDASVSAVYIDDNGTEHQLTAGTDGKYTVLGDTTVTFTNTKKAQKVKIKKTDMDGNALDGAQFTLDGTTVLTSDEDGFLMDSAGNKVFKLEALANQAPHELSEDVAPAGYLKLEGDVLIYINSQGVTASIEGTTTQCDVTEDADGVYIITVENSDGTELPMTGGIGTTIFYILGSILAVGCGIMLVARRRMRSEEK